MRYVISLTGRDYHIPVVFCKFKGMVLNPGPRHPGTYHVLSLVPRRRRIMDMEGGGVAVPENLSGT